MDSIKLLKQKKLDYLSWCLFYLYLGLIIFRNNISFLDVDLGWHLRVGKDLIIHGIWPKSDIYTFSHFGHSWVDHEWLSDAVSYLIYNKIGYFYLALLFALVVIVIFYLEAKIISKFFKSNSVISILLCILASMTILDFVAVRMQIITWLGLVLILYLLLLHYYKSKIKLLFLMPLIFLVWVNLHGGFIVGLFLLILYTVFSKKDKKLLIILSILSLAATAINPYCLGIWREIWQTITDTFGKSHIVEWGGILDYPINLLCIIYLSLFGISILKNKAYLKIPLVFLVFLYSMFIAAILHKRNIPIFVIASLPFMILFLDRLIKKNNIEQYFKISYIILLSLFFIVLSSVFCLLTKWNYIFRDPYSNPQIYPYQTVKYLKDNPLTGNTFTSFGWGGYLIWKMPSNYKVFYDGRMVHWHSGDNRFLKEYLALINAEENWLAIINKYEIKNIIIEKRGFLSRIEAKDWLNQLFYKNTIKRLEQKTNLYTQLNDSNQWKLSYENKECYIFSKTE